MRAIEVDGLQKTYGPVHALRNIDLHVDHGEVVALLGPNGAGKTTTVEILEGFVTPTAGSVRVLGFDPKDRSPEFLRRIGMVLQECEPEPYLTVRETLQFYAGYFTATRPAGELLESVGLSHKARARTRTLSGGERRRLDLAIALVGDPTLLFMDEPTTGFDPEARHAAWDAIETMRTSSGVTIVLTTHYLEEAEALADRVVVIKAGRVVAEGAPHQIGSWADVETTVTFRAVRGVDPSDVPVGVRVDGRTWVVETRDPTATLHALTGWALARAVELEDLRVAPPSLEAAYLAVTR